MNAAHDMFPETIPEPDESNDERYTPSSLFLPLHSEFGFTLDVCATPESAKCPRYFTKAENGLEQSWRYQSCWLNPPYSDIGPWLEKAWMSMARRVVALLPAWPDRQWWAEHVEPFRDGRSSLVGPRLTTRFLRGRISFGHPGNPEGVGVGSPMFGCVLLVWSAP